MHIEIINGPNLNLLGTREPSIYGNKSFESYFEELQALYTPISLGYFQSNVEGELINHLQAMIGKADGIILNAGGYTHTSVALGDCVAAIGIPVIEVHISNIYAREEFRKINLIAKNSKGLISGLGLKGYTLAIEYFLSAAH